MKVLELLNSPEKWTKYTDARDALNNEVSANNNRACKWCLSGAFIACYPDRHELFEARAKLSFVLSKYCNTRSVIVFNDIMAKWEDVQAVLTEANV